VYFVLEVERLKRFLSQTLIGKSGGKTLLADVVAEFTPNGVLVKDSSQETLAVYAGYTKKYFLEYEFNEKTVIPLTSSLYERSKKIPSEQVTFEIVDESGEKMIRLSGKTKGGVAESYTERMLDKTAPVWTESLEMEGTEQGFIPKKVKPETLVLIPIEQLEMESLGDTYVFETSEANRTIKAISQNSGRLERTLKPSIIREIKDLRVTLNADLFDALIANLEGDVWFGLHRDYILLSKKASDHSVTYLLLTYMEEGE